MSELEPGQGQPTNVSDGFTDKQQIKMAEWAVEDGSLTRNQANQILVDNNLPPIAIDEVSPNPVAAEIDHHFPPGKPHEYQIPPLGSSTEPMTAKEIAAASSVVRSWLGDARFTKEIGSSVAREVQRVERQFERMDNSEKADWKQAQVMQLKRLWKDGFNQKVNLARKLVNELEHKQPGLKHVLEVTGAGDSAMVIAQFALQAERLYRRKYSD